VRSFTALVNPISGGGTAPARFAPLADAVREAGAAVEIVATRSQEHAVECARDASSKGDVVVAVGGDGLVRDVASGVVATDGTMAIVPAGRGNDLALGLGLPNTVADLTALLLNGDERLIDVLDADGAIVPGNVYAGMDSVATKIINNNRRMPARLLYRVAPVLALARWRPAEFTVKTDHGTSTVRGHLVVIANSGRYGHGLHIVPSAELDDGRIDVLVVGNIAKYKVAAFMGEAKTGRHVQRPEVQVLTGTEIRLSADRPIPIGADGDLIGELPVTVRLRPGALKVIAPAR
jgi:diacylglycerol kinase family enzyme